jgi:hypothetical protein
VSVPVSVSVQVRFTLEVSSFFFACVLLLLLSTLHLTFVDNDTATRCFTSHVHHAYPGMDSTVATPMARGWWTDTDVIRLRVQAWELCGAAHTHTHTHSSVGSSVGEEAGGVHMLRSKYCHPSTQGNASSVLAALSLGASELDAALPPLYDAFSRLVGQHISSSPNLKGKRVQEILRAKAAALLAVHTLTLPCDPSTRAAGQCETAFSGSVGALLLLSQTDVPLWADVTSAYAQFLTGLAEDALDMFQSDSLYLYGVERGFLMLPPALRETHNVSVLDVVMPRSSECFLTSYSMLPVLSEESAARSGFAFAVLLALRNGAMQLPTLKAVMSDERSTALLRAAFEFIRAPSNWVVHHVLGYDVIVANWMLQLFDGQGYLFNVYTKDVLDISRADTVKSTANVCNTPITDGVVADSRVVVDGVVVEEEEDDVYSHISSPFVLSVLSFFEPTKALVSALPIFWQKAVILASTVFLFFTTSTLVSFTLKETQERMLRFTYLLQYHIRQGMSVSRLVCTHLIESLVFVPIMVGMLGFLYEFFGDSLLTFLLLTMLWICECYTVVCVRTTYSAMLFPRFSFVLFCLFHFYSFSFPFGFSYVALATASAMLWYLMLYFWNHYELPALLSGQINALNVRMMYQGE